MECAWAICIVHVKRCRSCKHGILDSLKSQQMGQMTEEWWKENATVCFPLLCPSDNLVVFSVSPPRDYVSLLGLISIHKVNQNTQV